MNASCVSTFQQGHTCRCQRPGWPSSSSPSLPPPGLSENPGLLPGTPLAQTSTLKWQPKCAEAVPSRPAFLGRGWPDARARLPPQLHCSGHGSVEMSEEKLSMTAQGVSNGPALCLVPGQKPNSSRTWLSGIPADSHPCINGDCTGSNPHDCGGD